MYSAFRGLVDRIKLSSMKSVSRRSKEVERLHSELMRFGLSEDYPGMDDVYSAMLAFKSDGTESDLHVPISSVQRTLVLHLTNNPDTYSNIILRYDGANDECPVLVEAA